MKYFFEFMSQYGLTIIHAIIGLVISGISFEIKKIYQKHVFDKTKKEVIKMVCGAINQLYPNESGTNKLNLAITNAKEILAEKGITISDLELRMYIEYTLHYFKNVINNKNIA